MLKQHSLLDIFVAVFITEIVNSYCNFTNFDLKIKKVYMKMNRKLYRINF